ncbi:hypothetical protein DSO57_1021657, partial [Entomophthora muscae]
VWHLVVDFLLSTHSFSDENMDQSTLMDQDFLIMSFLLSQDVFPNEALVTVKCMSQKTQTYAEVSSCLKEVENKPESDPSNKIQSLSAPNAK